MQFIPLSAHIVAPAVHTHKSKSYEIWQGGTPQQFGHRIFRETGRALAVCNGRHIVSQTHRSLGSPSLMVIEVVTTVPTVRSH